MEVSDTKGQVIGQETRRSSADDLIGALQGLYRAFHNMAIYPSGHPSVPQSIERAAHSFDQVLADRPSLVVHVAGHELLADDNTLSENSDTLRSLAALLHDLDVAAIEFHAGLAAPELGSLVELLAQARKDSLRGVALARKVADELEHLRLCPIDYRALSFGEGLRSSADPANVWESLSRALTDPTYYASAGSVEGVAGAVSDSIVQLEGTGVGGLRTTLNRQLVKLRDEPAEQHQTVRRRMADFLNALNPALRRDLLQVGSNRPDESLNLMIEFADTLPARELIEALENADRASSEVPEELLILLNKLVRIAQTQPVVASQLEKTLERWGVSRDVLHTSSGDMRAAMEEVFQVRTKAAYNPEEYRVLLAELSRDELPGLQRFGSQYRDPSDATDLRLHAAEIAVLLLGRTDGDAQRPALFGCVGASTDLLLEHGRYGAVHEAAVAARTDRLLKGESAQIRLAAEGYLGDFASPSRIGNILDGACAGAEVREDALNLLTLGGAAALDQVLDRLTSGLPPGVAQPLYGFATQQGSELWRDVIESRSAKGWVALRPAFPFLCDIPSEISIPLLKTLQTHESSRVRRQTLSSLCRVDPRTPPERYLGEALADPSFRVVAAALRRLAQLGGSTALDLLRAFVAGEIKGASATLEAQRLSAELLLSLGDAGRERLCDALRSLSTSPRPQNARRARMLAEMLQSRAGNPRVGQALRRWQLSPGWWVSRFMRME